MVAIYIHGENIYYRTDKNFHFGELRLDSGQASCCLLECVNYFPSCTSHQSPVLGRNVLCRVGAA